MTVYVWSSDTNSALPQLIVRIHSFIKKISASETWKNLIPNNKTVFFQPRRPHIKSLRLTFLADETVSNCPKTFTRTQWTLYDILVHNGSRFLWRISFQNYVVRRHERKNRTHNGSPCLQLPFCWILWKNSPPFKGSFMNWHYFLHFKYVKSNLI